ncbi:hypothetical protein MPSEU_000178300 [Mayamaea pseudoterrestris]|nr:hypothetical protein MPSEU_000178300 [Mayamaea pseudoterrestris]
MYMSLKELFHCSREGGWCWQGSRETSFEAEDMADQLWQEFCEEDPSLPRTISIPRCDCNNDESSDFVMSAMGEDDDFDSVIGIMLPIPEVEDEDDFDDDDCRAAATIMTDVRTVPTMSTSPSSAGSRDACLSMYSNDDDDDGLDSLLGVRLVPTSKVSAKTRSVARGMSNGALKSPASISKSFYEPGRDLAKKLLQIRGQKPSVGPIQDGSSRTPAKPSANGGRLAGKTLLRSNQSAPTSNRTRSDSLVYSIDGEDDEDCYDDCGGDDFIVMEPCRLGALPNTSVAYCGGGASSETLVYTRAPTDAFAAAGSIDDSSYSSHGYRWSPPQVGVNAVHRKSASSMTEDTSSVTSITSSCASV